MNSASGSSSVEVFSPHHMLWSVARKYPVKILASILAGFSGALFNGVGTALVVPILLSLLGQDAILKDGPPIFQALLSPFEGLPETWKLLSMAIAALTLIVLKNASNYLSSIASVTLNRSLTSDLQRQGLNLILDVDLEFFSTTRVGELVNRLGGETNRATSAISTSIRLMTTVITILVFVALLLAISWKLTLLATFLLPLSTLLSQTLVKKSRAYGRLLTQINGQYSGGLVELISGIRLVKSTGNEDLEYERFSKYIQEREQLNFKTQSNSGLVGPIAEITNISILFVMVLIARFLFQEQISALAAIMLTYLVLLSRLLPYISQLNSARNQFAQCSASVDIIYDLLRRDNKAFMQSGAIRYSGLRSGITFQNVSFAYPNSQEAVLHNINLDLPKGTTLALVGASGAGKTTLADLVPRFFDPTEGAILLDGTDLRDYDLTSVRRAMGIVSQDTFLFNNTVRYNIAYGNLKAPEDEILEAARRANAYEFIMNLPQGLDTMIGDRGVMLSGGQRQRLAIARALLQNPEILILDEATSALDTVSERLVQQAIDELSRDRTTLVIAHRLSTVQQAHQIAVMEKGRVIELGTHAALLNQGDSYSKLCSLQFEGHRRDLQLENTKIREMSQLSYELRTNLNSMTGLLALLDDFSEGDQTDNRETVEMLSMSVHNILNSLEKLEGKQRQLTQIAISEPS